MGDLLIDAWKTGGPMLVLLLLAALAVMRLNGDKEKLYERMIERADRDRDPRRSRPSLEADDERR